MQEFVSGLDMVLPRAEQSGGCGVGGTGSPHPPGQEVVPGEAQNHCCVGLDGACALIRRIAKALEERRNQDPEGKEPARIVAVASDFSPQICGPTSGSCTDHLSSSPSQCSLL